MVTYTTNFHFAKPGINDPTDQDLWGGYLNDDLDQIDTLLAGFTIPSSIPVGAGLEYWGATAPSQWVFAYGQALNRTTYSVLFGIYGTTYGVGDGSTTFNIPDKRGRASFGKDNMGGTSADRLTGLSGGIDGDTLGATGGEQSHVLTAGEAPVMGYTIQELYGIPGAGAGEFYGPLQPGNFTDRGIQPAEGSVNTGGGGGHNTVPPGIICNYIIYTGV